jgi:hypothetical protein
MAADEPLEVANWVRERVLGSGGFGQVTLWRHKTKDEMIGEVQLHSCQAQHDLCHTPSFTLVPHTDLIFTGHSLSYVTHLHSYWL